MRSRKLVGIITGLIAYALSWSFAAESVTAQWSIDVESGLAFSGYNDVRIPGNTGTDISLSEELKAERTEFVRFRLTTELSDRDGISILVAPLRFRSFGSVDRPVDFNGVRFGPGVALDSYYRFDSYRVSYQRTLISKNSLRIGLGITGKIRDAAIRIDGGGSTSEKANTGFVPLINFAIDWRFGSQTGFIFEGDALAAPQGRAEDVLIAVYSDLSDNYRFRLGYRILEGGADNDEVHTFALVNYLSAGVTWSF